MSVHTTLTTTTATSPRYGALAAGAPMRGHLLAAAPARPGQFVAAVCGEKRRKWQLVEHFADPTRFSACAACTNLAGPAAAPTPPVRIAPRNVTGPADTITPATLVEHTTQASRVERRTAFREGITLAGSAAHYAPRTYHNQLPTQ